MAALLIKRDNRMYESQQQQKEIVGKNCREKPTHKIYLSNAVLQQKFGISRARLTRLRNEQEKLIFTYSLNDNHNQKLAA